MKVKSLDELKKIREESLGKVNLRDAGALKGDNIEILVGMATCGISSGARETLTSFVEKLAKAEINNAKVVPVGCIGYCHSEPTVQVNIPGQKPVLYGKVKKDKVEDIIQSHIKDGKIVDSLVLNIDFDRA
ncbi:(2Fe-2S) ferredoxin domain-containing protein [Clostridium sp. D2Q-11]|uniref:(2Fe-2S) ferredoxin domain-containing protein n=1 Tax=Anaeromonas frigoriresistens TaxID=2683708 RepID=A0A942Z670_9FIRM|nr:(2Fe-2S) ferredoxin domain-containing protein [Anaeromonas frigoriresistens]MBS4538176.1 (2Fe-2S) ferredoxin domain-containing protein [Anaeromonas frigoriresistens]